MNNNSLLIPSLMLGVFALLIMELGVMGVVPIIAESYGVSVADSGWVVSVYALIVALSAPIMPAIMAKYNAKNVMILCLLVFIITSLLAAFCEDFILLLILRAIPAFFHPIYCALAFSVAANSVPEVLAPKATSKIFMAVSAGMMLGVPITSYVASNTSLESSFILFTALNALALLATLIFVPTQKPEQQVSQKEQFSALKMSIVWVCVLVVIAINAGEVGFYSYMREFLLSVSQLSFDIISMLLLLYGLSNVVGNVIAGRTLVSAPNATLKVVPLA